jgi:hypothetical protein
MTTAVSIVSTEATYRWRRPRPTSATSSPTAVPFAQALSRHDLVDDYRPVTKPAALGSGQPMFKDLDTVLHLDLVETTGYPDGIVITVYPPVRRPA